MMGTLSPVLWVIVLGQLTWAQLQLSIIHLNDFHARFEETSWIGGACYEDEQDKCVGGFARIVTIVNDLLEKSPNAIFLNAGDDFQGTLWYNIFRWNVTVTFFNQLPMDATTLGNHEFDSGIAGVVPYIENLKSPVLVANIDDSLEPTIQGKYNKSMIIERDGWKIGIVGYITRDAGKMSNAGRLKFLDEVEAVKAECAKLTAQGIKIIIGLSHAGIEEDQIVAAGVPDIDIIVGGHSHTLLYTGIPPGGDKAEGPYPLMVRQSSGRQVAIVQAGCYSKWIGNLTAWFDENGELVATQGNPILLDHKVTPDPDIVNQMAPWKKAIDEIANKKLGMTKVMLDAEDYACSQGECNIGSFLADALVDECVNVTTNDSWTYAAIGFINSGAIRTSIEETRSGVITYNDLAVCQPFGNTVDTLELQGQHLKELLEQTVDKDRKLSVHINPTFSLLQVSGIHVTFDLSRPAGSRVTNLQIRCAECRVPVYEPVQPTKWYRIVTVSYLSNGGDGLSVITENMRNLRKGRMDLDVYSDYLRRHTPIVQDVQGRITMLNMKK